MPRLRNEWVAAAALALIACSDEDGQAAAPPGDAGSHTPRDAESPAEDAAAEDAAPAAPSFARDVRPVFATQCVQCHHPDSATLLDLTRPFDPLMGLLGRETGWTESPALPLVDPGRPENSFLVLKITFEDDDSLHIGSPMPAHIPRLTPEEIEALQQWIAEGAEDDAFYRDTVALIFGDGLTLGRRAGKCAFCHYTGGPQRPDLMNPFDSEAGVVGVVGGYGRTLVEPGDPDASFLMDKVADEELPPALGARMPLWLPRVTPDEVAAIERWIEAGAMNN